MMSLPDMALHYAANGYRVFPCRPGTKVPLTEHGVLEATNDLDQIETWWTQTPNANIGLSTQGLLALDVDGPANPWLAGLNERAGDLAGGPLSSTPRGGMHFLFRQPAARHWRSTTGKLAEHVDTRADGGYIVVPPSVCPQGVYRWAQTRELDFAPENLPEPPTWLIRLLDELAATSPPTPPPSAGNPIPEGQRNVALTRLAGGMRRMGMTQDEIVQALYQANRDRCRPQLTTAEVDRIAGSIARYEPDQVMTAYAEAQYDQMQAAVAQPMQPLNIQELVAKYPALRPPVIHGLLRQGETMNIIASSKVGKSWLVTDLALAIATGRDWLGQFRCEQGEALILDNELHCETSAHRIPKVAQARQLAPEAYHQHVWVQNLRGRLQDVFSLGRYFQSLPPGRFKVIILDAFYRFMPKDMDENDNGTMASLYNHLDLYADRLGCSFILIHHTTKGNQAGKNITDVGAGAGSQSRATDTHVVLRPHEENDAVVLDAAVRSWPKLAPLCLRWTFPVWTAAPELDPARLRSERPGKKKEEPAPEWTPEAFARAFVTNEPQSRSALLSAANRAGLSDYKAERLLRRAEASDLVHRWEAGRNRPSNYSRLPPPLTSGGAQ